MFNLTKKRNKILTKAISFLLTFAFSLNSLISPSFTFAQGMPLLPPAGAMVRPSSFFVPLMVRGVTVHPNNSLKFDFIVDTGNSGLKDKQLKQESEKLIKYFLATITLPENDLWVNLSPYEKDRIIPQEFGTTEMGRDLLAQDYILKQLTSSLMYPEGEVGKKFWDRVYQKAYEKFGTTALPVNTFNKVWIVPDKAEVLQTGNTALVVNSRMKVMLEEDYLSLKNNLGRKENATDRLTDDKVTALNDISSQVVREVFIPELEKEVNEGKNFIQLRQMYNSMILAMWYKKNLQNTILGQVYANQKKLKGVDVEDKDVKQKIYTQYLDAFQKGVFNLIKKDYDPNMGKMISRKYFSGGATFVGIPVEVRDPPGLSLEGQAGLEKIASAAAGKEPGRQVVEETVVMTENLDPEDAAKLSAPTADKESEDKLSSIDPTLVAIEALIQLGKAALTFRQDAKLGDLQKAYPDVYTPQAVALLEKFAPVTETIHNLIEKEDAKTVAQALKGEDPKFLPEIGLDGKDYTVPRMKVTVKQARSGDFEGAPVPKIFQRPGITLTGPTNRHGQPLERSLRSIAYQLLSGAENVLLDGEDALGQLDTMSLDGIRNIVLAYKKGPVFMKVAETVANEMIAKKKRPQDWNWRELIEKNYTTRIYRVRGLHLDDRHLKFTTADGRTIAISASLADLILYVVNTYEILLDQGAPIAVYWPKFRSAEEAALVAEVLDALEAELEYQGRKLKDIPLEDGKPGGIIKVLPLVENVNAAMQAMEIRAALDRHIIELDMARWDYIATVIKAKDHDRNWVPDDFRLITMTYPFMHTAEMTLWRAAMTPDRNGNTILAEGGMEVQIPTIPDNIPQEEKEKYIKAFMAKAEANKDREARAGFSFAWVAHPDMVYIVAAPFKEYYDDGQHPEKAPVLDQKRNIDGVAWTPLTYTPEDEKAFFTLAEKQEITVEGVRHDISVAMQYFNNVVTGQGAASIKPADFFLNPAVPYLMEDRATREGREAGVRKKAIVQARFTKDDESVGVRVGDPLTKELFLRLVEEEFQKLYNAPDRIVYDSSKETTLRIARMALEKFVLASLDGVYIPWSVDLEGIVLGINDPKQAEVLLDQYIEQLKKSGGVSRMTENPLFESAAPAGLTFVSEDKKLFVSEAGLNLTQDQLREAAALQKEFDNSGVTRPFSAQFVVSMRPHPAFQPDNHVANEQARMFRDITLDPDKIVSTGGAISGRQAVMYVKAGAKVIYLSGWEGAGKLMLPDISSHSIDEVVRNAATIIDALRKASAYERRLGRKFDPVPIVVDIDAGFGSPAKIFNLVSRLIQVGVGIVHIENQDPCEKACGHLGDKLQTANTMFRNAVAAARLAFDVAGVKGVIIGRTDSEAATLIRGEADTDPVDLPWLVGKTMDGRELTYREAKAEGLIPIWDADPADQQVKIDAFGRDRVWIAGRAPEGFYRLRKKDQEENLAYAIETVVNGFGDMVDYVWLETNTPSLEEAEAFAKGVHAKFPGKPLVYNLSASFKWRTFIKSDEELRNFVPKIHAMGYKFSFITLMGFHSESLAAFEIMREFVNGDWMLAYAKLQDREFALEEEGYTAVRHQEEVGAEFMEALDLAVKGGKSARSILQGSTETDQFYSLTPLSLPLMGLLALWKAVEIPDFLASSLERYGLKVQKVEVAELKPQNGATAQDVLKDEDARAAVSISINQALGSIGYAGQGAEAKTVADANAVFMGHQQIIDAVRRNPKVAYVSIASEGIRDGSVGTPLGRIYWDGYGDGYRNNSIDKNDYEGQLTMLRRQGIQIIYLLDDGLENTNALKAKEAVNQPTDAWSAVALQYDRGEGPFRYWLDETRTRRVSIMANAPRDAQISALDSPRQVLHKLAVAHGIQDLDSNEGRVFAKRVIMAVLGERKAEDQKESSGQRHSFYIDEIAQLKKEYGVRSMIFGDGDLMPGLVAASGIQLDDQGSIVVKFGRSGLPEAEIMDLAASQIGGAQMASRKVSTKTTKDRVTPETALQVEDGLLKSLMTDYGYPANSFTTERRKNDMEGKAVVAMTAVTGADPQRYLGGFAQQLQRVTVNEANGTITTHTFLVTPQGVFAVRTTFKADDLQTVKSKILSASPEAQAYVSGQGAMAQNPGGIDYSALSGIVDLQIIRDEQGIPLPVNLQPIGNMRIEGFFPIITNIIPITPASFPLIFGLKKEEPAEELSRR